MCIKKTRGYFLAFLVIWQNGALAQPASSSASSSVDSYSDIFYFHYSKSKTFKELVQSVSVKKTTQAELLKLIRQNGVENKPLPKLTWKNDSEASTFKGEGGELRFNK